ncbi:hypothetical protein FEM48_Zijuj05G0093700 [Ziziphus jujuba var. spinosa]|uniref:Glutathione S-transferase n=1 Tax=Ziziphus jujuba var. spinosa TaxID=714518 RepID=A0A978VE52_ZIZJJ|nr:hypothetical protein FEM48_Zijuj05G0093700 [Ziziphus jujuba var. spinosa]
MLQNSVSIEAQGCGIRTYKRRSKKQEPLASQCNPVRRKVPVFVQDGKPFAESLVILEYIDEVWKENPFLPHDPSERAIAHFWAKFADEKLHTSTTLYIDIYIYIYIF